jgi:hypothetical protein
MKNRLIAVLVVIVLIICVSTNSGEVQSKSLQKDKKVGVKSANLKEQNKEVEKLLKQLRDPQKRKAFEDWVEKNGLTEDVLEKLRAEAEDGDRGSDKSYGKDSKDEYEKAEDKGQNQDKKGKWKNFLKSLFGDDDDSDEDNESTMPKIAMEYVKMCEPELGVPPRINLDDCVEIPLYINGVQKHGALRSKELDNPNLQGKGFTSSGSVLQRYEGRTADGKPLPDVIWIAFGRNEDWDGDQRKFIGSVQMIGYNKKTGATAFFESRFQNLNAWVKQDKGTLRMRGKMPWIDNPREFNKAYVPAPMQCVSCHQADPFVTNPFIKAATIPGTDKTVVPKLDKDSPYYVIGGENWDMRTMHIEGNSCFDCHRVGMKTLELFLDAGWDPNKHMPPRKPGSLADDYRELMDAWKKGPENVDGAEWIIPPARGKQSQVVGEDYPHKARFNRWKKSYFFQ